MKPFIKWAGGKRKFAESIARSIGKIDGCYYEPFVGSGAVLLHIQPAKAVCSDVNQELINLYKIVRENPNELIEEIRLKFVPNHCKEFYYSIRDWDRNTEEYSNRTSLERAARFMYLNKTCYNGIWRVNSKGFNNVPIGRYTNPHILVPEEIQSASEYFNKKKIEFFICDYKKIVGLAKKDDFVYFDPPYDVDDGQSGFIAYTKSPFNRTNQIELKIVCDTLVERGVRVGISNSSTHFIKDLYLIDKRYRLANEFSVNRTIGATSNSRRNFSEIFIIGQNETK